MHPKGLHDAIDDVTFIGDVGQNAREEVNVQPASGGGENYGWRLMEGSACYEPSSGCNDGTLTLPAIEYVNGGGQCAVVGGYRYRGSALPALDGVYFFGDYCSGDIFAATTDGDDVQRPRAFLGIVARRRPEQGGLASRRRLQLGASWRPPRGLKSLPRRAALPRVALLRDLRDLLGTRFHRGYAAAVAFDLHAVGSVAGSVPI